MLCIVIRIFFKVTLILLSFDFRSQRKQSNHQVLVFYLVTNMILENFSSFFLFEGPAWQSSKVVFRLKVLFENQGRTRLFTDHLQTSQHRIFCMLYIKILTCFVLFCLLY